MPISSRASAMARLSASEKSTPWVWAPSRRVVSYRWIRLMPPSRALGDGAQLGEQYALDRHHLAHGLGDEFGHAGPQPVDLQIDREQVALRADPPRLHGGRHEIALGEDFDQARKDTGFCNGADGEAGSRSVRTS